MSRALAANCSGVASHGKRSGVLAVLCKFGALHATFRSTMGGLTLFHSNYLSSLLETRSQPLPLKRHIFSADVAVQTDSVVITSQSSLQGPFERTSLDASEEEQISSLTAADLASILKWSKEISGDINLSMALQRLTEIATGM